MWSCLACDHSSAPPDVALQAITCVQRFRALTLPSVACPGCPLLAFPIFRARPSMGQPRWWPQPAHLWEGASLSCRS